MVRITFELLHPTKNITEYEHEGTKKKRGQLVSIQIAKKLADKAKFWKLFHAMRYGRDDVKHMAQMLGEAFIITIYHNIVKGEGGAKDKTYVNLDDNGAYGISAPFIEDPISNERSDVPVQANIQPLKMFLFDNPNKECWDSLFIDGTREVKDDKGNVTQKSKNWLQAKILSATNIKGSALEQMLGGLDNLPTGDSVGEPEGEAVEEGEAIELPAEKVAAKPDKKPAATKPKANGAAKPAGGGADAALAALGLA